MGCKLGMVLDLHGGKSHVWIGAVRWFGDGTRVLESCLCGIKGGFCLNNEGSRYIGSEEYELK